MRVVVRPGAAGVLAFVLLYKLGDAFAGSLMTPFLLQAMQYSTAEVGVVNKVIGLWLTIGGALVGSAVTHGIAGPIIGAAGVVRCAPKIALALGYATGMPGRSFRGTLPASTPSGCTRSRRCSYSPAARPSRAPSKVHGPTM